MGCINCCSVSQPLDLLYARCQCLQEAHRTCSSSGPCPQSGRHPQRSPPRSGGCPACRRKAVQHYLILSVWTQIKVPVAPQLESQVRCGPMLQRCATPLSRAQTEPAATCSWDMSPPPCKGAAAAHQVHAGTTPVQLLLATLAYFDAKRPDKELAPAARAAARCSYTWTTAGAHHTIRSSSGDCMPFVTRTTGRCRSYRLSASRP